jgi:hypothetical protein
MRFFFLLLGTPFFGVAALVFFLGVMPEIERNSIHRTGTPGVGEPFDAVSNLKVNEVPYYYIKFKYTDSAGNQKTDATSSAYTKEEMQAIKQDGKLSIKYTDKGAVQADFKLDSSFYIPAILSSVFGCVGLILLTLFVLLVGRARKLKIYGSDVMVKFVSSGSYVTVNNEKRYYIEMAYRDLNTGRVQTAKTESIYKHYEAEFFKELGEFKARCYENMAMILEDREKAKEMLLRQPSAT